jgi:hypothetical protein
MGIRKSKNKKFIVDNDIKQVIEKCKLILKNGGFKNIRVNESLNQLSADYKKFTIFGEIEIILVENNSGTEINLTSTANVDNIFALFSSPNNKIMNAFINNF